ncbi:hypothetical protein C8R46DRAFT_1031955 [Mycena filopes]|nr:hypothetical protein C8R46DRAFT_1031955 [Mycena filopes]
MFSATTSSASLVSNNTVSSRAPLTGSAPTKDFQAAFASLQSTYGFAASAPTPVQKKKNSSSARSPSSTTPTHAVRASTSSPQTKDYQSAFADLQSTYGFCGAAPMPVARKQSTTTGTTASNNKLFAKFRRSSSSSAAK